MHISDGVLSPSVLAAGYIVGGGLAAVGLGRMRDRDYPLVGVMTAAFFVAGLVRVPVPPTSVHVTLNSLLGVLLGVRCFPAILVALLLQAMLLGQGGLTTLGVNMVMMAVPGYLAGAWLRVAFVLVLFPVCAVMPKMLADAVQSVGWANGTISWPVAAAIGVAGALLMVAAETLLRTGALFRWGFAAGAAAVLMAAGVLFAVLTFAPLAPHSPRDSFRDIARFAFVAHTPIVFLEGVMVALVLRYLARTQPALLREQGVPVAPVDEH
jgi:cobalt/nickel transport system permease protein